MCKFIIILEVACNSTENPLKKGASDGCCVYIPAEQPSFLDRDTDPTDRSHQNLKLGVLLWVAQAQCCLAALQHKKTASIHPHN